MPRPAADVDSRRDLLLDQIEHRDLGVRRAGDVGRFAVGRDGNSVRLKANLDLAELCQLLASDFQHRHVARIVAADKQRLAVRRKRDANRMMADGHFIEHSAIARPHERNAYRMFD